MMNIKNDLIHEFVKKIAHAVAEELRSSQSLPAESVTKRGIPIGNQDPEGVLRDTGRIATSEDLLRRLPQVGFLRLKDVLVLIPVSKSTWYQGIAEGRYPRPTKQFGPRIATWDVRDIRKLLEVSSDPK